MSSSRSPSLSSQTREITPLVSLGWESFVYDMEKRGKVSQPNSTLSCPNSPRLSPRSGPPNHTPSKSPFACTSSRAAREWERRKKIGNEKNKYLDQLMKYQGLEEVKQFFLDIKSKVDICKEQEITMKTERLNVVFQGNPGTGKTTIARLYGKFISSLGFQKYSYVTETSGVKLVTRGIDSTEQLIKDKALLTGVLFIDEAYQLTAPYLHGAGNPVLDIILTGMEDYLGELIFVFAGYKSEMEPFFEHNPGLSSRIPYTLHFADFTDDELWRILCRNIKSKFSGKMKVEGGLHGLYMRIAIRRLAQSRGSRGFGNARAVENLLAKICQRQSHRLAREKRHGFKSNPFLLIKEDLIGPDPTTIATRNCKGWAALEKLIGLEQVKESVKRMIGMIQVNYRRELKEMKPLKFCLNQVFVGSPGTGKTTVASLYGQILAELGYLSRGDVVLKTPADFIGVHLGESEVKTKAILEASVGKVLVIDEAYMLDPGDPEKDHDKFSTGAIDTIVSIVQGTPGEDRCIILIGYEQKMKDMFHNANPGLSRRFPIHRPFRFENYNTAQLEQILRLKLADQDLAYTEPAIDAAREIFERALMQPNFTNAGEVNSIIDAAKMNYEDRLSNMPLDDLSIDTMLEPADFDPEFDRGSSTKLDCRKMLEGLVHSSIADKFVTYQNRYLGAKKHGMNPRDQVPTRLISKGPSGTGKTTVAQKIGELFYNMGILSTSEVIECSATDLLGQYLGQTAPKTRRKLQEALGRVLLIDEANRLIHGQYATEAVDELIQFLGKPANEGKIIVILAGYTSDLNQLMSARPVLSSHFPEEIIFSHIPPDDCIVLLVRELERNKFTSEADFLKNRTSNGYARVRELFNIMQSTPSWGNARDVINLRKQILGKFLELDSQDDRVLSAEHVLACMEAMIQQQRDRCTTTETKGNMSSQQQHLCALDSDPDLFSQQLAPPPVLSKQDSCIQRAENLISASRAPDIGVRQDAHAHEDLASHRIDRAPSSLSLASEGRSEDGDEHEAPRDEGVSDAEWLELLKAKQSQHAQNSQREAKIQKMLAEAALCPVGYRWYRVAGGYRCEGGSHFMNDAELNSRLQ
ncbi:P-loop containing nucleoside triphosphate hydrolase protein [Nemania sp. FL0916]|nr:P-loop containing nucleoside triphosphate hydrolase protein [Nemania sp. FL0916]